MTNAKNHKELIFPKNYGSGSSFVGGSADDDRLTIRYFIDDSGVFYSRSVFGRNAQGPPAHVHGGAMAAVLDETLGLAAWVAGYPIVSANLNVTYVNMLPLNTEVTVMTKIESVEDRKVLVSGEMKDESGKIYSKATVLCIIKSVEMLGSVDFREYIESRLKQ